MSAQDTQSRSVEKEDVYIHVYNKGVESRKLFKDEQDYQIFIDYLRDYISLPQDPAKLKKTFSVKGRTFQGVPHQTKNYFNKVELLAYSLLPDHFHLLVKEVDKDSLQKLIRSLSTRYAIYYNKRYQRSGSLFQGPYKSARTKYLSQLLYLTRYIHREPTSKVFSSYKEYLGERESLWVMPNIILNCFDNLQNGSLKDINDYKDFVEKQELEQKERKIIKGIVIEKISETAEKIEPETKKEEPLETTTPKPSPAPVPKPRQRIPEFVGVSAIIFLLLFTVGARNILISADDNATKVITQPISPTPQVAGVEETQEEEIIITETEVSEELVEELTTVEETQEEEILTETEVSIEPNTMIVIKTSEEFKSVNLRKEPTTESEIVGTALDGDTYELISKDEEWYQIKLDDGSAFVLASAVEIEEEI